MNQLPMVPSEFEIIVPYEPRPKRPGRWSRAVHIQRELENYVEGLIRDGKQQSDSINNLSVEEFLQIWKNCSKGERAYICHLAIIGTDDYYKVLKIRGIDGLTPESFDFLSHDNDGSKSSIHILPLKSDKTYMRQKKCFNRINGGEEPGSESEKEEPLKKRVKRPRGCDKTKKKVKKAERIVKKVRKTAKAKKKGGRLEEEKEQLAPLLEDVEKEEEEEVEKEEEEPENNTVSSPIDAHIQFLKKTIQDIESQISILEDRNRPMTPNTAACLSFCNLSQQEIEEFSLL